jgi:outer membrane protein OmpA-like peptidoglycan-associated protein
MRCLSVFPHVFFCILLLSFSNALAQDKPTEKKEGINIMITQSPKIKVKVEMATNNVCYGEAKGAINITPSGGFPPYRYLWSSRDTTQDVAGLKAGLYSVIVFDDFSCSDTVKVSITEPDALKGKIESTKDILCYGYNNGEVDISVTGGKMPYTYNWSNGAKTQDIKGVNSGHYSVLITDANSCQEVAMAEILERPLIVRWVDDVKNIKCSGDSTGSIDITVNGGIPPYTYEWSNKTITEDIKNVTAGSYQVVVKDAKGCTEVSVAKVVEPAPITVGFDRVRNLNCHGDNGGSINITVKGGNQPYIYQWSNGAKTQDLAGIGAGNYSLKVTDMNGCSKSTSQSITEPDPLTVNLSSFNNIQFYSGKNGSINIDVSGGVPPYKYRWSNGSEKQNITSLEAGSYSVRVTDAVGCAKILSTTLTQPRPLVVQIDELKNINCNGTENGSIAISVAGGVTPYVYKWSNGATAEDISSLSAGTYSLVVTDANGYSQKVEGKITEPAPFRASVVGSVDILCSGDATGSIDVKVEGGVTPYRYRWSNGQISQDMLKVTAGEYTLKVSDANLCEQSVSAVIKEPQVLAASLAKVTHVNCFGLSSGGIDIAVNGGTAPYKYKWNNNAITEDINAIKAGGYSVSISDSKGCMQQLAATITEPPVLMVREESVRNVDCNGNASGALNVIAAGGVTPYQFNWSNGATTKDITGLKAGSYSLKVSDANGCSQSFVKVITEAQKLTKRIDEVKHIVCYDDAKGAINVSVVGGTQPYRYNWSNGAISQDVVDVKAGRYSLSIKDANGCTDSLGATISQSPQLLANLKSQNIKCFGEKSASVFVTPSGGVAPYTYKWNNGAITQNITGLGAGNYSVTVFDSKGCYVNMGSQIIEPSKFITVLESNGDVKCAGDATGYVNVRSSGGVTPYKYRWSNGDSVQNISKVPAGAYSLMASDKNGCTQTVKATLIQPSKTVYSVKSVTNVACNGDNGGAIDIIVSGGIGPYTYKWSNGATSHDLDGIPAGKYAVQISDVNGCSSTLTAEVTQPEVLDVKLSNVTNILCNGEKNGSINITVTGGVAPYKYSWSNGAITEDISGLPTGNFSVTVTDVKGCSKTIGASVTQPPPLTAKLLDVKQILCNGEKTGAVTLELSGGVQPYAFKWSNGATSQNLSGVAAGTYSVEILDKNGCKQTLTAVITQPLKLNASLTKARNVTCNLGKDGYVDITVTGGSAPYKYTWNNGTTTQDLFDIASGAYSVVVSDAHGCKDSTIHATLKQPSLLDVQITKVTDVLKYAETTGSVVLAVSGGVPPYVYNWSNGSNSANLMNMPGGNYTARVRDANGCEKTVNATIQQPPILVVKIASIRDVKCQGEKTGAVTVDVTGGVPPYKFAWSNGDSTKNLENIRAGDYSLSVIDANAHRQSVIVNIAQPSAIITKLDAMKDVSCFDEKTGAINVTVTGGLLPYRYSWNSGQTTDDIKDVAAGNYEITVTDGNGCTSKLPVTLKQPSSFAATVAEVSNVNCFGDAQGSIVVDVKGGVAPYTYVWNNGARSKDLSGIIAGDYTARITDANGCISNVAASVIQPSQFVAKLGMVVNNKCSDEQKGSISLTVSGGTTPYVFNWSNGDSIQNIANLRRGEYTVTVVDNKGCQQKASASITEPSTLLASVKEIANIKCSGEKTGAITTEVSGGVTPYNFSWNSGVATQNLSNATAGDYVLTVKDANGCTKLVNAKIIEPAALVMKVDTIAHIACFGDAKGLADISVSGGTMPFVFSWSNGSRSEDLVNAQAGNYTVSVQDAKGCTRTLAVKIDQPEKLVLTPQSTMNIKCAGGETGSVGIAVSGGVTPYRYLWTNGSTDAQLSNIAAGEYSATVTDENGCKAVYTTKVTEPINLVKTIDAITNIRCYGDTTGSIQVTVRDGTAPYNFKWSNGATSEDLKTLRAGNYKLTITEANGCQSTLEANVEEPTKFNTSIVKVTDIPCFGMNTGEVEISASGGVEPYSYIWSNGSKTKDLINVVADHYSVIATDANGCSNTLYPQINEPEVLTLHIDSVKNVKCCGDRSGAIFITVTGGVKPYDYKWSHGARTEDITDLVLGVYTVNVTDAKGCVVATPEEMSLYEEVVSKGKFTTRDILFDVGKATIKPESFNTINRIASFMKEHPDLVFSIEGHTDSDGDDAFNMKLSQDRANSIRQALIKFGIRENRLQAKGYGETRPIAANVTAAGKAQNRRVEFVTLSGTVEGTLITNLNE